MTDDLENMELATFNWSAVAPAVQKKWSRLLDQVPLPPVTFGDIVGTPTSEMSPEQWVDIIIVDPVLSAKVLAVANSASFGLIKPVTDIKRAIVHLGNRITRTVVTGYYIEGLLERWDNYPADYFAIIQRWSACASIIAYHIAHSLQLPHSGSISTAALLSRLGSLALAFELPNPGDKYIACPDSLARLEFEKAGWEITTPILSCEIARRWNLPAPLPEWLNDCGALPLLHELENTKDNQALLIISTAVALALPRLRIGSKTEVILSKPNHATLKQNLESFLFIDAVMELDENKDLQRSIAVIAET